MSSSVLNRMSGPLTALRSMLRTGPLAVTYSSTAAVAVVVDVIVQRAGPAEVTRIQRTTGAQRSHVDGTTLEEARVLAVAVVADRTVVARNAVGGQRCEQAVAVEQSRVVGAIGGTEGATESVENRRVGEQVHRLEFQRVGVELPGDRGVVLEVDRLVPAHLHDFDRVVSPLTFCMIGVTRCSYHARRPLVPPMTS